MTRQVELTAKPLDFESMYRQELAAMIALATSMTGDRNLGADLAQEGMVRLYQAWPRVSTFDRPGAWLRRVVINLSIDAGRRLARESSAAERLGSEGTVDQPEPATEEFWRAVRSLPDRQRAAVALHYLDDMAITDIAEVLDVTVGTIKASLFKARQTLAKTLGAEEVSE